MQTVAVLAAIAAVLVVPTAAAAKNGKVRAQTLNLYLGSDLTKAVLAPDIPTLRVEAGNIYENIVASDPRARLKIQAKLIKKRRPQIIGLQEVETLYRGTLDDPAPADEVVFDFEQILKKQLKKRNLPYRTVVRVQNTDVEVPTDLGFDVRLVDHDILLVRKHRGINAGGAQAVNFAAALNVPLAGGALGSLKVLRGYVEANVKVHGTKLHVVNTHLEAFLSTPRDAQADELVAPDGPLDSKQPVLLLGDLNSAPDGTSQGDSKYAYDTIIANGFQDLGGTGLTCCFSPDLLGGQLTTQIDHVLVKPGATLKSAKRTGAVNSPLTSAGQYPSDHTGVVSQMNFR